jgi:hypothetical protein
LTRPRKIKEKKKNEKIEIKGEKHLIQTIQVHGVKYRKTCQLGAKNSEAHVLGVKYQYL